MRMHARLLAGVTGLVLLAGLGTMGMASPASAGRTSGLTVMSIKQEFAPLVKEITVIPPAKKAMNPLQFSFPVTGAKGIGIQHSGGIQIGKFIASNPEIVMGDKRVDVAFQVREREFPLLMITGWKKVSSTQKKQTWKGTLRITDDALVVALLNRAAGRDVFKPGVTIGQIQTMLTTK